MYELIKIEEKNGQQLVSARELHEYLQVKSRFNDWIINRINKYNFEEYNDYTKILVQCVRGQNEYDYAITLDMAKELCMVENNDLGRQARKYFIACEKQLKENTIQFEMLDSRLGVLQRLVNECESAQARDKIRLKMATIIGTTRKENNVARTHNSTVLNNNPVYLEEYVSGKDFDNIAIKDAYIEYQQYGDVGRTTFCRCVYAHGYERREIKDKNRNTVYIFKKVEVK